ncbi:hypothetical protein [Actinokineospora sp. NBRC 105648]|uniref:hypothetical protein n=1 Tax=Actinokineospora sp. NBRC 105648 TaxID=3032206 RepID=UPI0024A5153E|nr:hypothetical protein [Actinokineospora sp. NBRC 105648]GLZ40710.1 hypothetical protein Acsp05_43340 [Actinokineospora sp. NBRC 105648]
MTGWQGEHQPGGWQQAGLPRPSRTPAVLSIAAIIVIVGTVITIVLVNRGGGSPDPIAGPQSSTSRPPSTRLSSSSRPPTFRSTAPTTTRSPNGRTVDNAESRISFTIPGDWRPDPAAKVDVRGVNFSGAAAYGAYECGGAGYTRAFAVSAAVQNPTDKDVSLEKTATTFTAAFGEKYYPNAKVAEPAFRNARVDGKQAVLAVAKVTPAPKNAACEADAGEVAILAVDLDNATATRPRGIALLVIAADLSGGPNTPGTLSAPAIESVLSSAHIR